MIRRAALLAQNIAPRSCISRGVAATSSARTSCLINSSTRLIHHQRGGININHMYNNNNHNDSSHHRPFSSFSSSPSKSLKKVIRPFLVACHPDLMHAAEEESAKKKHPLSNQAKD
eukprot:scaffold2959_cov67-Skeletonema_dohrnii-CCMP3373.AAC.1